jgi:hypothetical protein
MPVWSGKFQYLDAGGAPVSQGPCQFQFEQETAIVTPAGEAPIAFDLGDVDRIAPAEWDLSLTLYTGHTLSLSRFGASFADLSREFLAAWRDRTVRCLLLEDLEEIGRYNGTANGAPAELRIYRSNLAVLPHAGVPLQWRLAEIDSLHFDQAAYQIVLASAGERLVLGKLAKKTDEVLGNLAGALDALRTQAAQALHNLFPFLAPEALRRLQIAMPEGRSASLADLAQIDPRLPDALIARAVDAPLKPYFEALRARAQGPLFAGFKFIRPGEAQGGQPEGAPDAEAEAAQAQDTDEQEAAPLFFWFFFPLPGNLAAWEATTGSGRATYFFRTGGDLAQSVRLLTRGLALVNFRREPVYLPDASLEQQPKFHRYAIGARKLPDLRALRAAFAGRAVHSSLEEWTAQAIANR